jgi:hypothetical protein
MVAGRPQRMHSWSLLHLLQRQETVGHFADHFDRIDVNRIGRSLVRRLERLGRPSHAGADRLKPLSQQ